MSSDRLRALGAALLLGGLATAATSDARAEGVVELRTRDAGGAEVLVDGVRRATLPPIDEFRLPLALGAGRHRIELRRSAGNPFYDLRALLEIAVEDDAVTAAALPPLEPQPLPGAARRIDDTVAALVRDMATVAPGSFLMGSPDGVEVSEAELPRHRVTIAKPFLLSRTEATFDQWDACVADGGCGWVPGDHGWSRGRMPVMNVSWDDARPFVDWLNRKTGRRFRLPSEAEWEYAARAGADTAWPFGDDPAALPRHARYEQAEPAPVGSREANRFGLHDMLGNVGEWVGDCWHETFDGAPLDGSAWTTGGNCRAGVVKGGDFDDHAWYLRPAHRSGQMRRNRYPYIGLRLAADP